MNYKETLLMPETSFQSVETYQKRKITKRKMGENGFIQ